MHDCVLSFFFSPLLYASFRNDVIYILFRETRIGTVMDLPYRFTADGDVMERNDGVNFATLMGNADTLIGIACCFLCLSNLLQ